MLKVNIDTLPMTQARYFTNASRGKGDIRVVVIHDMEAPESSSTAENVANWWAGTTSSRSSAHYCVDNDSAVRSVYDEDVAWHAPGVNHDGIGIELAGYARQTRAQWLDDYSKAAMEIAAQITAQLCARYDLNVHHLSNEELRAGHSGIIGHVQASEVYKKSSHWDPGPNFPWDYFMERVRHYAGGGSAPEGGGNVATVIGPGDTGPSVKSWQQDLMKWNPNALPNYKDDGDFGDETTEWTNRFFVDAGLTDGPVDEPAVGPKSRERMKEILSDASKPAPEPEKPDYNVVVLYDERFPVDEGMALVYGARNALKVLPFKKSGKTYAAAFLVGAVARREGEVKDFIEKEGFSVNTVRLGGGNRQETAQRIDDALERGYRNHPGVDY